MRQWLLGVAGIYASVGSDFEASRVTFVAIAMAEVGRAIRFVNVVLRAWIMASSWLLSGASAASAWHGALAGLAVVLLSLPRGRVRERYGLSGRFVV